MVKKRGKDVADSLEQEARRCGAASYRTILKMKQRKPGLENLTEEIVHETIDDFRKIGLNSKESIELGLAQLIIINTLGGNFWAKECTTFGEKQIFFKNKSDVKIIHLAGMLWSLKDSVCFEEFLEKNNNNDFESTYYECVAAHWFLKNSSKIEFVIPISKKGSDFDIKIYNFYNYKILNLEVKARRESFQNEKSVDNFLKKLRTQLPSNGSGAVLCKLELSADSLGQEQLVASTKKFLCNTNRIDFVVYCWDVASLDNILAYNYFSINKDGIMQSLFNFDEKSIMFSLYNVLNLNL